MITLKQIDALIWIANLGSFEAAAKKLNTTQSAVSKRIQDLEMSFETEIFDRSRRSARLTPKGEEIFEMGTRLLEQRDLILERMSSKEALVRRFRIGVTELTSLTWLPRLVQEVRQTYPKVVLEAEVDLSANLHKRLIDGTIDMIIVPDVFKDARLVSIPLQSVENAWMCSPDMVKNRKVIPIEELSSFTLLIQGGLSGSGIMYEKWLRSEGVALPNVITSNSAVALAGLAISGLGITYLPKLCFIDLVEKNLLKIIKTKPPLPKVPYVVMYRVAGSFHDHICELAQSCCDFTKQFQR